MSEQKTEDEGGVGTPDLVSGVADPDREVVPAEWVTVGFYRDELDGFLSDDPRATLEVKSKIRGKVDRKAHDDSTIQTRWANGVSEGLGTPDTRRDYCGHEASSAPEENVETAVASGSAGLAPDLVSVQGDPNVDLAELVNAACEAWSFLNVLPREHGSDGESSRVWERLDEALGPYTERNQFGLVDGDRPVPALPANEIKGEALPNPGSVGSPDAGEQGEAALTAPGLVSRHNLALLVRSWQADADRVLEEVGEDPSTRDEDRRESEAYQKKHLAEQLEALIGDPVSPDTVVVELTRDEAEEVAQQLKPDFPFEREKFADDPMFTAEAKFRAALVDGEGNR